MRIAVFFSMADRVSRHVRNVCLVGKVLGEVVGLSQ